MKTHTLHSAKLAGTLSLTFLLAIANQSIAGQADTVDSGKVIKNELRFPKNNFKINLSSLALKNYSLFYERSLSRKISFTAGYRSMPSTNLGELSIVKKVSESLNEGEELIEGINRMQADGQAYTGEFRFYGGKKPGARGMYLALYGRYATFNHNYDYRFTTENDNNLAIPINSKVSGLGAGILIGKQTLIAKRLTLDIYAIGGHYGKLTGTSQSVTDLSSLSNQDKQNLKAELDDILVIQDKPFLNSTVTNQGVTGKISGPFAGVRGLGFSLGIAF